MLVIPPRCRVSVPRHGLTHCLGNTPRERPVAIPRSSLITHAPPKRSRFPTFPRLTLHQPGRPTIAPRLESRDGREVWIQEGPTGGLIKEVTIPIFKLGLPSRTLPHHSRKLSQPPRNRWSTAVRVQEPGDPQPKSQQTCIQLPA